VNKIKVITGGEIASLNKYLDKKYLGKYKAY
jgi:hypothetical protein